MPGPTGATGPTGPTAVVNTDGNPGTKIYVGVTDPATLYTLQTGDVWFDLS